jgi:hypothetical protein
MILLIKRLFVAGTATELRKKVVRRHLWYNLVYLIFLVAQICDHFGIYWEMVFAYIFADSETRNNKEMFETYATTYFTTPALIFVYAGVL